MRLSLASVGLAARTGLFVAPLVVLGLFSANPAITAGALFLVPFFVLLLWRPGEPPALLFAVGLQWSQVAVPIFAANFEKQVVDHYLGVPGGSTAAGLGLVALALLALGMRIGARSATSATEDHLRHEVEALRLRPLLVFYLAALTLDVLLVPLAPILGGLRQPLLALAELRWVAVFLIFWGAAVRPGFRLLGALVLMGEVILGLGGFFSAFKYVLFLSLVVFIGAHAKPRSLLRPGFIGVAVLTFVLVTFWQAVKEEYRAFLNQNTATQAVLVSPRERADFLLRTLPRMTVDDLTQGWEATVERVGYIEYFARCVERVPRRIPHQDGRLWGEAIRHVLMPRLLFPEKPVVNDSDRTNEFTGVRVATAAEGSSISIGYAAESYIDFGSYGMFVPILLLGVFWGWAFSFLVGLSPHALLGLAAGTNLILSQATFFESSNIKLLGGGIIQLVVLGAVLHVVGGRIWAFVADVDQKPLDQGRSDPVC